MSKTYNVLQSASYGQWVKVKANNKEEAIKKVNDGDWTDEDIVSSELVIRETTGDVEEVSDDYLRNYNNADEHEIYGVNPLEYEK